jgi:hypothetical protein
MILLGQYTTAQREEALEDAERRLTTEGHVPTVALPVKSLKTMPVLFQPREFIGIESHGRYRCAPIPRSCIRPSLVAEEAGAG